MKFYKDIISIACSLFLIGYLVYHLFLPDNIKFDSVDLKKDINRSVIISDSVINYNMRIVSFTDK